MLPQAVLIHLTFWIVAQGINFVSAGLIELIVVINNEPDLGKPAIQYSDAGILL